jgi:hypothetical protein
MLNINFPIKIKFNFTNQIINTLKITNHTTIILIKKWKLPDFIKIITKSERIQTINLILPVNIIKIIKIKIRFISEITWWIKKMWEVIVKDEREFNKD